MLDRMVAGSTFYLACIAGQILVTTAAPVVSIPAVSVTTFPVGTLGAIPASAGELAEILVRSLPCRA